MSSTCPPLSSPRFVGDPRTDPRYALGRKVVRWIESNCRYGQGDRFGQRVGLERFQVEFLLHLYELNADGIRRYRRALLEIPKGNGKTPLSAWVGAYELCNRDSAVIPVAAASYDQADLLFGDLRDCVRESPSLSGVLDAFENEVQVKDGPGSAYKVAAIAGTNDGQRPSCFLADEIHEWLGNKARVHLVIANGCAKRAESLQLNTTTPGADLETLAGKMHLYGLKVNSGEVPDREFLFVWYGCPEDRFDLDDPEGLRTAIRAANPAADRFLNVEDTAARFHQVARYEFCRYHLGQWTSVADAWLPDGVWAGLIEQRRIADGADVCLGFDGSFNNDSTALVVVTCEAKPHVEVVDVWERPDLARDEWQVPILDVEESIRRACRRYRVREVVCDPFRWARTMQILEAERLPMVEFPQNPSRMTPATTRFYEAAVNGQLSHSGDPRLARHISNCVLKEDSRGRRITKESRSSTRRIDLAVSAVMAFERAAESKPRRRARVINLNEIAARSSGPQR